MGLLCILKIKRNLRTSGKVVNKGSYVEKLLLLSAVEARNYFHMSEKVMKMHLKVVSIMTNGLFFN